MPRELVAAFFLVRGSFISAPYVTAIALPPPRVTDNTLRPLGSVSTGPQSAARRAENRFLHPTPNENPSLLTPGCTCDPLSELL